MENAADLPSALDRFEDLRARIGSDTPAVFLDYDGVLAPIVRRPEEAVMTEQMRSAVKRLAEVCPLAVVSGRDLRDVRKMAGLEGIVYAGSHGFEVEGPHRHIELKQGTEHLTDLDRAEKILQDTVGALSGVWVERKKFAIAVHFREAADEEVPRVEEGVGKALDETKGLRRTGGKKIVELRPDIDWDKGKAVAFLLEKLRLNRPGITPIYIGDDLTDEDAFRELRHRGIGIVVRDDELRPTAARYALDDTEDVREFLQRLAALYSSISS